MKNIKFTMLVLLSMYSINVYADATIEDKDELYMFYAKFKNATQAKDQEMLASLMCKKFVAINTEQFAKKNKQQVVISKLQEKKDVVNYLLFLTGSIPSETWEVDKNANVVASIYESIGEAVEKNNLNEIKKYSDKRIMVKDGFLYFDTITFKIEDGVWCWKSAVYLRDSDDINIPSKLR